MAYARSLDLDAKWSLAADVYETIIAHVHPDEESEIVVNALLRQGHCLRREGRLTEASEVFTTAGNLAHQYGDMIGILLVVSLAMSCFNPPVHSKVLGRLGAVAEVAIVVAVSLAVFSPPLDAPDSVPVDVDSPAGAR